MIEVIAHSGYRGDEAPRAVVIAGVRREVTRIRRQHRDPDGWVFEVELADPTTAYLVLRCDLDGHWSIEAVG